MITTKKEEKTTRTMDVILIVIGVFLLVFVAIMIWLYYTTGGVPDTLITCVFGGLGLECGAMSWIKNTKERYRERQYELEDREYEEKMRGFKESGKGEEI